MADYNNLIGTSGDVAQMLGNDSAELATFLPRAVEIAEQRIYNELPAVAFNDSTTGVTGLSTTQIARPQDITTLRYLKISNAPLLFIDYTTFVELYGANTTTGTPVHYTIDTPANYIIGPAASGVMTWVLGYRKPLAALTVGSPSNWLTTNAYSLLLTATVVEAVRFVIDDRQGGLLDTYERKYGELLAYYSDRETRNSRDDFRVRPMKQSNDKGQKPGSE